jgi:DNA-binding CsgD family transcriptional regulator
LSKIPGNAGAPNRRLPQAERADPPQSDDPPGGHASAAALIFDTEARLIYVSAAFGELVGLDPGDLIGSGHPFPWCRNDGFPGCRARIQLLAGREARELGIESVSWSLARQCGECLRVGLGPENTEHAFENELRGAMCFAVCDGAMMERIRAILSLDVATPRRELEAALRRIALEVERLGLSVMLPARPQENAYEELRSLTPREWEVLHPFMEGRRVPRIARMLSISPHTVRNHLQSIYAKLGVGSQEELIEKLWQDFPAPKCPETPQQGGRGVAPTSVRIREGAESETRRVG